MKRYFGLFPEQVAHRFEAASAEMKLFYLALFIGRTKQQPSRTIEFFLAMVALRTNSHKV